MSDRTGHRIIDSPPPCSRLCRREPASDTRSPPELWAGRLDPTRSTAVTRRGADLDQVPLVDFCNQKQSTSTTGGSTDPRSRLVDAARPACAGLGGNLRMGLKPSAMSTTGSGWCCLDVFHPSGLAARWSCCRWEPRLPPIRRAAPAEVSRVRGRPAFAARHLPSGAPRARGA